jgi:hypothetical protein
VTRTVLAAAAVLCLGLLFLGLFALSYGFTDTSEALQLMLFGAGLVVTSIGAMWLVVELFAQN